MIRRAEGADARLIQQLLVDFLTSTGREFSRPTLADIRRRLRDPNIIAYVDDTAGASVELEVKRNDIEVASLFPRGMGRGLLFPLLSVQENPLAILEIRRILKEQLRMEPATAR